MWFIRGSIDADRFAATRTDESVILTERYCDARDRARRSSEDTAKLADMGRGKKLLMFHLETSAGQPWPTNKKGGENRFVLTSRGGWGVA
jgi:hypothetical protein